MVTEAGQQADMPEMDDSIRFFVDMLFEAGPGSYGGQSMVTLSWSDLQAWQIATGVSLPPWQTKLLRRLSRDYVAEMYAAEAHDAPTPWVRVSATRREKVASHIRKVMRG